MLNWQIVRCIFTCILSFSFVHAPVCANCKSDSCYIIQKKKKKKKKEQNDPYFGMGKNTKVMPQKPRYLSFPWEREGILHLGLYKIQNLVRFLPCPPAHKIFFKFRHCVDDARQKKKIHTKLTKKIHFLQISHLSSNRRVRNLTLFPVHNPSKRAHPQNEIRVPRKARISDTPCFFATLSQRNTKNLPRKARISDTPCFFATLSQRNAENLPRKQHEIQQRHNSSLPRASKNAKKPTKIHEFRTKLHSLTPATMPRKVSVFHNFAHRLKYIH